MLRFASMVSSCELGKATRNISSDKTLKVSTHVCYCVYVLRVTTPSLSYYICMYVYSESQHLAGVFVAAPLYGALQRFDGLRGRYSVYLRY